MKKLILLSMLLCMSMIPAMADDLDWTEITVTALDNASGVFGALTAEQVENVVSLKVNGTINSYDIITFNNKMTNLQNLDLSNAKIVDCSADYRSGYHTSNDVIGVRMFSEQTKYRMMILPKGIKSIGGNAFYQCTNLYSVVMQEGLKIIGSGSFRECKKLHDVTFPVGLEDIESSAFQNCIDLESIVLPNGLKRLLGLELEGFSSLLYGAFYNCKKLKNVVLPPSLEWIGNGAFANCPLENIVLPPNITFIGHSAFSGCSALASIKIPSAVKTIRNNAFEDCDALRDIYTYTIEPTKIYQDTFGETTYNNATLHVPATSFNLYYWNTEWSQFKKDFVAFDEEYNYFYLNNDYELDNNTGKISGDPDADVNEGGGLIVEGDDQGLGDVHVKEDGDKSGSIIGDGNINANKLYFDITVKKNRWYFMSFPYQVKIADIVCGGSWIFRYYDGGIRAEHGSGGWQDLTAGEEYLQPGRGYIFQTNQDGVLQIPVEKTQFGKMEGGDRHHDFEHHPAEGRPEDASWNFMGNPYTSYFDIDHAGYDGPITVWNGTSYETVRPGDDDYHLRPFEGFFMQKPDGQSSMDYQEEGRHTYQQWEKILERKHAAPKRAINKNRHLVNLTLTDGTTTDKTRIVFNSQCAADYEIGTDAAKFMTAGVPQLFTQDGKQVRYAINERPEGEVQLGYTAVCDGELTISAPRMDLSVVLKDNETGTVFDLSTGSYSFTTKAGTFANRFTIVANAPTGISATASDSGTGCPVYDLSGKRIEEPKAGGVYITAGKKVVK